MSVRDVEEVIRRAAEDDQYRSLLTHTPYDALEGYNLEPDEQGALIAASDVDLIALGADADAARRFSELFRISPGGGG